MAVSDSSVLVGVGVLTIGTYTASGGAGGTMTDVGHIRSLAVANSRENFDVETDRAFGIIKRVPIKMSQQITAMLDESRLENFRIAFAQPAANLSGTGTTQNGTLLIGQPAEQYHQAPIVGVGVGSTASRTWTFWKCAAVLNGEIPFQKAAVQNIPLSLEVLYDSTLSTADKFGKIVDP